MKHNAKAPLALVILDGWGQADCTPDNAVCQARTPVLDRLFKEFPHTTLGASGLDVGLPDGQMGNSEVGHLNIGAGRVVYQDLTRISKSIEDGDFFTNPVMLEGMRKIRENGGKLHLCGLLSDGGVHSHNTHLYALVEMAKQQGIGEICIHAFMDGRDTPPKSGAGYLRELENQLQKIGAGVLATVSGRFYAMDRDNRWERIERAWQALVHGRGITAADSAGAIADAYAAGQSDEFVEPRVILRDGRPLATVDDGDGILFFNFRADRARELTRAFTFDDFDGFDRGKHPELACYLCLTEYDETFGLPVIFPPESYPDLFGEVLAKAGKTQLRIAETEKYAHVTFFFNGGVEEPFAGEDRALIPSPQDVATYDQKPEMSAAEVTDEVVTRIESGQYDVIILNFANPDMVGHTGVFPAAVKAMETVDACLGRVVEAVQAAGGGLLITADHGNCEKMSDHGQPHTAHTSDPVALLLVDDRYRRAGLQPGVLADLAPTMLQLLGLPQPAAMTGRSLLQTSA
ncbi:2,3-bisphosphoglycerate-independent phosphoglycerate mutase [Geothermobacter hydrogeniphilus]|uniref:2,3-bisphosphoglycerate-independent phosphoglycerate mutase n=1 Tax=Geothermobacter hydrogeniphilus TaxID=1969733 RepID=A0A1X0Y0N8_9BACT|nr:2,3-bisphosphoglycerate-independent phosphoglycerate mutase [Geothermobacter hydrogeniphilus]ORJ58713.1 phosphoglycerate mutase (2,3-diphosphoglycerate-independent) [Geothermobacter hydrogeniphilus]